MRKAKNNYVSKDIKSAFRQCWRGTKTRWLCREYVKTENDAYDKIEGADEIITGSVLVYNHEKCVLISIQIFNNSAQSAALDDLCERPMKMIWKEIKKCDDETRNN